MVIGWFTRIVVVLAVLAVVGVDGISLLSAHLSAQDDANNAASNVAAAWQNDQRAPDPFAEAAATASGALSHGETIVPGSIHIAANGTVTLEVHRVADHTLVAHDLGFLKHEVTFDTTGTAPAPSS